jgi:hypothetical protein
MGKIIKLKDKSDTRSDNLITSCPWEFRRADWESRYFIQMLRSQSIKLEKHRIEIHKMGEKGIWNLPPHFVLKGGMAYTIQGIYSYRKSEKKMREDYYLAGLIDCMINQVNPLLRTDLIRDMYKKIVEFKSMLNMNWYGHIDQLLFPIDIQFYNQSEYRGSLSRAKTMKELYLLIREGTDTMWAILSCEYSFYTPGRGI